MQLKRLLLYLLELQGAPHYIHHPGIDLEMKGMSRALVLGMKGMLMAMAIDLPLENM